MVWCELAKSSGGWAKVRLLQSTDPTLSAPAIVEAYSKRWSIEIVFTQMTKAPPLAVRADGDDVADLDLVVGDHDAVDQPFNELTPSGEIGFAQTGLNPAAEIRGRSGPAGALSN